MAIQDESRAKSSCISPLTSRRTKRKGFARIEAFAPLNGLTDDSPPRPGPPGTDESAKLTEEARMNLATARELIERCGYHRRDEELAELEAVLSGSRRISDLPSRV